MTTKEEGVSGFFSTQQTHNALHLEMNGSVDDLYKHFQSKSLNSNQALSISLNFIIKVCFTAELNADEFDEVLKLTKQTYADNLKTKNAPT